MPGHVMAISDPRKGLIIEARGYPQGYGKVHELPVSRIFKGIKTVEQLYRAIQRGDQITRLDAHGKPADSTEHMRILSMRSCLVADG